MKKADHMVNLGLILCDIRMPKVNGVECIDYLRREAPGIPTIPLAALLGSVQSSF